MQEFDSKKLRGHIDHIMKSYAKISHHLAAYELMAVHSELEIIRINIETLLHALDSIDLKRKRSDSSMLSILRPSTAAGIALAGEIIVRHEAQLSALRERTTSSMSMKREEIVPTYDALRPEIYLLMHWFPEYLLAEKAAHNLS